MHDDGYFGDAIAATYDDDTAISAPEAVEPVVDFLADLAGDGRALEFAIGTGRIAVPLHMRGVPVAGIELSQAMVRRLRTKATEAEIPVAIGDMATTRIEGSFSLVYLVFNTIGNLTTQEAQVACFRNAAAHLHLGGRFVVELGVPRLRQLPPGQTANVFALSEEHWGIDEYDVVNQGLVSHHFRLRDGEVTRFSTPFRYAWPSELDLMAQLADLTLRERWEGWGREPFTGESGSHISVWEKPA